MLLYDLNIIHRMLREKTSGFQYLYQWIKVLNQYSWKIFHMKNIDQKEWKRIIDKVDPSMSRKEKDLKEYTKVDNIQHRNTKKLKTIIDKKGCITISKFGMIASHSAWLIVQHSNHDREFQKRYLDLMEEQRKDVFIEDIKSLKRRLGV
jgi:ATP-dependent Lon protease